MSESLVCRVEKLEAALAALQDSPPAELCTGPFPYSSNPSGRLQISDGTILFGNNQTDVLLDWTDIGARVTPSCITDLSLDWIPGDLIVYARRARVYVWLDIRLLINGVPVVTQSTRRYLYRDERTDNSPEIVEGPQYEMEDFGDLSKHRYNVPASATVSTEIRLRARMAAAQSNPWVKIYGPYRAHAKINAWPKQVVI